MWISEPMPVTTRIISADSGSSSSVKSAWNVARRDPASRRAARSPATPAAAPAAGRPRRRPDANDADHAPRRRLPPDTAFDSRRPKAALTRKPRNGSSGISSSMAGVYHFSIRERVGVQRLAVPEQRDHDRQADRRLGRRHRHDEEHDHLAVGAAERAPERHERQVHGVQHDLDRQQDRDEVAAHEHAGRADREQDRRQHEIVDRGSASDAFRRLLAPRQHAPRRPCATRIRTEVTSNGKA